jgi:phosphate transport system substrate-binding protein
MLPKKYWIRSTLLNFLGLPLIVTAVGVPLFILAAQFLDVLPEVLPEAVLEVIPEVASMIILLPGIGLACLVSFLYGRKADVPDSFLSRYMPFLAPMLYILLAWPVIWFLWQGYFSERDVFYASIIAFTPHCVLVGFAVFIEGLHEEIPFVLIALHALFLLMFLLGVWKRGCLATRNNRRAVYVLLPIAALMGISAYQLEWKVHILPYIGGEVLPEIDNLRNRYSYRDTLDGDSFYKDREYRPFKEKSQLTALRQKPAIQFTRDYPRLDGATIFFPVYAAAAKSIYLEPKEEKDKEVRIEAVQFGKTPDAYKNLISGDADLIFALAPSEDQKKYAADSGLTLTLTPIAQEAFVFVVNAQNPVTDLHLADIRAIYSGKINNWRAVGGKNEKIIPFQRPENSGSQTILLQEVMRGEPVRKPLQRESVAGMGILLYEVANDYHNLGNAIGYSFRFYAQEMYPVSGIRLLSIDGIAPTPENIRTRRYPLIVDIYMVTARPLSGNAQKLHDWFLSPEGQQLIEDVGYVPAPAQ